MKVKCIMTGNTTIKWHSDLSHVLTKDKLYDVKIVINNWMREIGIADKLYELVGDHGYLIHIDMRLFEPIRNINLNKLLDDN